MAEELKVNEEDIVDFDLSLVDCQPSALIGLHKEFLSSPRMDNMVSSLCSLDSIIEYAGHAGPKTGIASIFLFDHEEVGSTSMQGANSNMILEVSERIFKNLAPTGKNSQEDYFIMMRNSMIVSADMAHAIHPNYPEYHQESNAPKMQEGIILKVSAGQKYTTDAVTTAILREVAGLVDVPL